MIVVILIIFITMITITIAIITIISQVKSQIDDVKDVMAANIDKVLERGEKLEDVLEKSDIMKVHEGIMIVTVMCDHNDSESDKSSHFDEDNNNKLYMRDIL